MRSENQQPAFNRVFTCILGIERPRYVAYRHSRIAAPTGGHGCTSRCRKNIHPASLFERREESTELALVGSFRNHIQRVLALDYCFALDPNPEPRNVAAAQMVEKLSALIRIARRAPLRWMRMPDHEPRHDRLSSVPRRR